MTTMALKDPARNSDGSITYRWDAKQGTVKTGYFENTMPGHAKWWEFTYDTHTGALTTKWGAIGTGKSQSNSKAAQQAGDVQKLVISKLRKGYRQMTEASPLPDPDFGPDHAAEARMSNREAEERDKYAPHGYTLVQSYEYILRGLTHYERTVEVVAVPDQDTADRIDERGFFRSDYDEAQKLETLLNGPSGSEYPGEYQEGFTIRGAPLVAG